MQAQNQISSHCNSTLCNPEIIIFRDLEHTENQHLYFSQKDSSFTGKEKDSETGFYYFGARYYDPTLSGLFISVDPMSDKYPNISPYHYCHWNPVKLVDPDGSEDDNYTIYETGQIYKEETFDNTNTYTYVRNDMTSVDLGTYNVCYNDYGEDVISIGEKSQGNNMMFSWIGINSGNLFFEEDAFAGFLGGVQFFYDNYADSETQPVRVNQMMSSNRIHSHKGGRHSAIDIAYYNSKGVPGAHVDRPKDDISVFFNGFLAQSLNKFALTKGDITSATLSRLENGINDCKLSTLLRINFAPVSLSITRLLK